MACVISTLHSNYLNESFLSENKQVFKIQKSKLIHFNIKNMTQTNPKIFWEAVSDILMLEWKKTISTENGLKAQALITITSEGFLTYEIIKSSSNRLFNAKLKVFLDDMKEISFPKYQWALYSKRDIIFTDRIIPYRIDNK